MKFYLLKTKELHQLCTSKYNPIEVKKFINSFDSFFDFYCFFYFYYYPQTFSKFIQAIEKSTSYSMLCNFFSTHPDRKEFVLKVNIKYSQQDIKNIKNALIKYQQELFTQFQD